jgi:hypothetical protein
MQHKHFPPWLFNSCYYSYCVSNDNNTKRERGVKRKEGESEKEKKLKGDGAIAMGWPSLLLNYVLQIFLFFKNKTSCSTLWVQKPHWLGFMSLGNAMNTK